MLLFVHPPLMHIFPSLKGMAGLTTEYQLMHVGLVEPVLTVWCGQSRAQGGWKVI